MEQDQVITRSTQLPSPTSTSPLDNTLHLSTPFIPLPPLLSFESQSMIDSLPTPFFYSDSEPLITLGNDPDPDPDPDSNHFGLISTSTLNRPFYPYSYPEDIQVDEVEQIPGQDQGQGQGQVEGGGDYQQFLTEECSEHDYDHGGTLAPCDYDYDQHQTVNQIDNTLYHPHFTFPPVQFPQAEYALIDINTYHHDASLHLPTSTPTPTPTSAPVPTEPHSHSYGQDQPELLPYPSLPYDLKIDFDTDTKASAETQAQAQVPVGLEIDQIAIAPNGLWTPITSSFSLPTLPSSYHYDNSSFDFDIGYQQQTQIQDQVLYQDHTPTLAPHYPQSNLGLEVDLETEMTRDLYPFSPFRENGSQGYRERMGTRTGAVRPFSTTDLRPTVSCRPTINFSLPSALGDQVHNLETFGLKAVAEHDPYISYDSNPGNGIGSGGSGRHTPLTGLGLGLGYGNGHGHGLGLGGSGTTYLPPPKFEVPERKGGLFDLLLSRDQLQIRDQGNQVGRYDYPSSGHRDGNKVNQIKENQYRGGDQQYADQDQDNRYRYRTGGQLNRILSGGNGHGDGQRRMDDGMALDDQYGNGITPYPQPGPDYREDQTCTNHSQSQMITPTSTSTGAESLLSLLHSQPPPPHAYRQGYHPSLNINTNLTNGYNPPTPLDTSTASIPSNTTTFLKSYHAPHSVYQHGTGNGNGNGPTLPGVDQIFDLEFNRYSLSNPPPAPVQQTYSAPPSTIFPNAPHWSRQNTEVESNTAVQQAHAHSHVQILHSPPQPLHQVHPQRSVSMASISKNRGMPTRIGFSVSPSPSIASLSFDLGQDQDMSRESSAMTETSLESEGGVNDDEEVLSEYRPNKNTSKKSGKRGGKGKHGKSANSTSKSRPKSKGKRKGQAKAGAKGNGKASGRGRPTLQPSAPMPTSYEMETVQAQALSSFPTHPSQVQVQPLPPGNGDDGFGLNVGDCVGVGVGQIPPKLAGYYLVWEDGVAYTEDAELKQTAEVRRICYNCHTKTPPSWRKSLLTPGKILCNKCGIYERTHFRPRPQQQDDMKLRRNPTPPPSVGGYEPLVYPPSSGSSSGEGEGCGEESGSGSWGREDSSGPNGFEPIEISHDQSTNIGPPVLGSSQNQELDYRPLETAIETDYQPIVIVDPGSVYPRFIPGSTTNTNAPLGVKPNLVNVSGSISYPNQIDLIEIDTAPIAMSISSTRSTNTSLDLPMPTTIPVPMPGHGPEVSDLDLDPHQVSNISSMGIYLDTNPNSDLGLEGSRQLPSLRSMTSYRTSQPHPDLNSLPNSNSNSNHTFESSISPPNTIAQIPDLSHGNGNGIGFSMGQELPTGHGHERGRRTSMTPYSRPGSRAGRTLNKRESTLSLRGVGIDHGDRDKDRDRDMDTVRDIGIW